MRSICGRRGENSRCVHADFFLFSLTKVLFLIMKNKMTKLNGIDYRSLGSDVCIPQIIHCVSVAEIVDVQIENVLVCMHCRS